MVISSKQLIIEKRNYNISTIFFFSSSFGQSIERTYLRHGHNNSTTYAYGVTEITIHSNLTFTWKNWDVNNKKEWKTYKKYKPEISIGKITQNSEFYNLTDFINGNKTNIYWTVKFNDRRLNIYYLDKNKKHKKSAKYKRIW